jgi:Transferase family
MTEFLENNFADRFTENGLDTIMMCAYIVETRVNLNELKSALQSVFDHFPILTAHMASSGKKLYLPNDYVDHIPWTAVEHDKPLSEVFTIPSTVSDRILLSSTNVQTRMNFFFPKGTSRISRKGAAGKPWPVVEVYVQRFSDKTTIGLAWNHMLMDGGGMLVTVISSWTKALRGEALPDVAPSNDVLKSRYPPNPTAPTGSVLPTFCPILRYIWRSTLDTILYGFSEFRTIFIPDSVILEWKANITDVSTNDLLTAWLFKAWASTIKSKSSTVSTVFIMDLRKRIPDIVPATYLRNASFDCVSTRTFAAAEINKMSELELARDIRATANYYTPEVILNDIAYREKYSTRGLGMLPEGDTFVICSSVTKFNLRDLDFGGRNEWVEIMGRPERNVPNLGCMWSTQGGVMVTLSMHKRKWKQCVWKELSTW